MVERYLCLMLSGKIHGIDLSNLVPIDEEVEVVEDHYYSEEYWEWRRPPPPPLPPPSSFDFTIDLPAWDMQLFSLDSKIFLVGGSDDDNQPCYQIYEFQCHVAAGNDDNENKKAELNSCESISKVPAYLDFYNSHIACVSGEAYFLTFNDEEWCFWALRSCGGEWERLSLNTLLETQDSLRVYHGYQIQRSQWLYYDKRLFLPSLVQDYNNSEHVLCCFDLQTRQWTMEEFDCFTSFHLCLNDEDGRPLLPSLLVSTVIGLEDYTNYSVMLSYSLSKSKRDACFTAENYPSRILAITKIFAMLVNRSGVCVYQRISTCLLFKGIKPYFTSVKEIFFVDLGEGKTCAMLFGFALQDGTKKVKNIVLCVSIFTLTLKDEFDITTANHVESWNQEQRFLSVRVLSSHVYTIEENLEAMDYDVDIQQVFDDVLVNTEDEVECCKLIAVHAGLEKGVDVKQQLQMLKSRDTRVPKVPQLSGRMNVWEIPEELRASPTIIVSGHHGKLHVEGLRVIIDEGGGYAHKPVAAIVLPSMKIIRDTDVLA